MPRLHRGPTRARPLSHPLEIVVATGNRHKLRELAELLHVSGIRWRSLAEFPEVPPVRETGSTLRANAILKAKAVARATHRVALADDSGLCVDALGGAPGVRSARYAGRHGDDDANNLKLLDALHGVPASRRRASYRCVLALAGPRRLLAVTEGVWAGSIARAPRGGQGFGYDPLFCIRRYGQTVGELRPSIKRRLSHRARAARAIRPALRRLLVATERRAADSSRRGSSVAAPGRG